jgi:hypothetical protein
MRSGPRFNGICKDDEVSAAVVARRTAAVLAACSAVLHAVMLGHAGTAAMAVLIAGMALVCLYCARELWLRGTSRAWCLVAVMNLAMVAVHLPMSGGHHVAHPAADGAPQPTIMTLATVLSMIEVVIAVAVLCYRTRRKSMAGRPR